MSRADFHRAHARLESRWLAWVATELYRLSPPAYAAMVRRELQRLTQASA